MKMVAICFFISRVFANGLSDDHGSVSLMVKESDKKNNNSMNILFIFIREREQ